MKRIGNPSSTQTSHLNTSRGAKIVTTMSSMEGMTVMEVREICSVQAKRRITSCIIAE